MSNKDPHAYLTKAPGATNYQLVIVVPVNQTRAGDPEIVETSSAATYEIEVKLNLQDGSVPLYYEYVYLELPRENEEDYLHIMTFDENDQLSGEVTFWFDDADDLAIEFDEEGTPPINEPVPCIHLAKDLNTSQYQVSVLVPLAGYEAQSASPTGPVGGEYELKLPISAASAAHPLSYVYELSMNPGESSVTEVIQDGNKRGRKRCHESFSDPKDFLPPIT